MPQPAPIACGAAGKTAVSISLTRELLKQIDARADALELPRSRYLAAIAQINIARGGPIRISERDAPQPTRATDLTPEAVEFLKYASSALVLYQDRHGDLPATELPAVVAESELWEFFLKQRDQLLRNKWCESQALGQDIGMERTLRAWLQVNHPLWSDTDTA